MVGTVVRMCLRAGGFALAVGGVYALVCRKRLKIGRLLSVMYLAALTEIIGLRGLQAGQRSLNLIPFGTTLGSFEDGVGMGSYHLVGNLIWFTPLGWMLRRRRWYAALGIGAAVSAGLELTQWLLATGMTDVDDVWINALGTLIGWALAQKRGGKKG